MQRDGMRATFFLQLGAESTSRIFVHYYIISDIMHGKLSVKQTVLQFFTIRQHNNLKSPLASRVYQVNEMQVNSGEIIKYNRTT